MEYGISIGVSPREPLRNVGELAAEIERHGFGALWIIDFQNGMKDVYAAMLIAALGTEKLLIGPGVTNLVTRHPTVTANAMTALDEVSDGRALLGLGAGWSAVLGAGSQPSRLADIRDGVVRLRTLMEGEKVSFGDAEVDLATAAGAVPVYLAVSQPGMLRLCGETADGAILMGAADPDFCAWQLGHLYEGLERAARDRAKLTIDLVVTMSIQDDEDAATDDVRAWATSQAATFQPWRTMPSSWERFRPEFERAAQQYHLSDHLSLHAGHKDVLSDEFVRSVAIAGNLDTCVARVRELASLDVDRITFALLSGGRRRRLEQLANDVVPAVSGMSAAR